MVRETLYENISDISNIKLIAEPARCDAHVKFACGTSCALLLSLCDPRFRRRRCLQNGVPLDAAACGGSYVGHAA